MHSETSFYDELAPLYHLIYQDWNASIERQGRQLAALIEAEWPNTTRVVDVACGVGTQTLALAQRGYQVTASDLAPGAIKRARQEAERRHLPVSFSICDMRAAHAHHGSGFDIAICADNSLPHLLTDDDLLKALQQMRDCVRPGGGCLITVRDYAAEPRGRNIVRPYGARIEGSNRFLVFQVWDFEDRYCNITFYFVEENLATGEVATRAMRSRYYAVSITVLIELMSAAGFQNVRRLDDVFYQPVLVGSKSGA